MSNRRRLRPPAGIAALSRAYRCADCPSETGQPHRDRGGVWHVRVTHEDSCPVLAGTVSPLADSIRAATATGAAVILIGRPA